MLTFVSPFCSKPRLVAVLMRERYQLFRGIASLRGHMTSQTLALCLVNKLLTSSEVIRYLPLPPTFSKGIPPLLNIDKSKTIKSL